jgi:hypothetical protein
MRGVRSGAGPCKELERVVPPHRSPAIANDRTAMTDLDSGVS